MNRLEQSREYLRQYLGARKFSWFVWEEHHNRARFCLQDLGGMAGDWRTDLPYTTYYYPQKEKNNERSV